MIQINEAIIVEGKYDKIRLSSVVDAVIIPVNGFRIYKDSETMQLIRSFAQRTGIIILTDSDSAGRRIRGYIRGAVGDGSVKDVYIPDIFGKEKRKEKPSAEGKLGVEGISQELLLQAFEKAGITSEQRDRRHDITSYTMYELGLSGTSSSSRLRKKLQSALGLPEMMSAHALRDVLDSMMDSAELRETVEGIKREVADSDDI
ncbi:MAG: DUF4093 domain-containing protein [Ruminococcus sp.]|nr:DUF4093 domain-containing protein [Ruminococcus sp.]